MKRVVGVAVTFAVLVAVFSPGWVGAVPPPPCPGHPQFLDLEPLEAFVDGGRVTRGANGRFSNDAGLEFDVEYARLAPAAGELAGGCMQPSTSLTITVIDPFTGSAHELEMEVVP